MRRVHLRSSDLGLLVVVLVLLRVWVPFLRGLPLRLIRLPFVSWFVLHGWASEIWLPLRSVSSHESVLWRELGPVMTASIVRLLSSVLGLLDHLAALFVQPQLPEALVIVGLRLIFFVAILATIFLLWLFKRFSLVLAPVLSVEASVVESRLLLRPHFLVFALAVLPPVVVLLLHLTLLVHTTLLLLLLLVMHLAALVSPLLCILAVFDNCLDQGCNSLSGRINDPLRLLSCHFALFALFQVPLELGSKAEAFEDDLLILARLRGICLLMLDECIREIEF